VKQVFTNLVRNAVRHGCDRRRPMIEIERYRGKAAAAGDGLVWIRLYDNGPGIPAEYRQEVFLPGRRLPGTTSTGSGMGLAIVKRIIDHYGGSIFIDSRPPTGTAFVFSLPAWPG
jgi:signal transduction histidine kinase